MNKQKIRELIIEKKLTNLIIAESSETQIQSVSQELEEAGLTDRVRHGR